MKLWRYLLTFDAGHIERVSNRVYWAVVALMLATIATMLYQVLRPL